MITLRSKIAQKLLTYFFVNPHEERYVNELARILDLDPANLNRKLKQFEKEGLFVGHVRGKEKYYSLNQSYPLLNEYQNIFNKTLGIEKLLSDSLKSIKGIDEAYIFGSYAENQFDLSSDIDVLVIGDHDMFAVQKAVLPIQDLVSREINVIDMTKSEFDKRNKENDPLISKILSSENIRII